MNKQDIKKMGEAWSSVVNPTVEVLEEGTELFQVNIKGEGGATIRARSEKEAIAKAFKKMRIANRFTNDKKFMSGVKVVPAESVETDEDTLEEGAMCESCGKAHEGKCNPADVEAYKKKQEDASNDEEDDGEGIDKVDPKAAKKKFKDRKDKDIDNDGDVDSSDEFLHKRRKAIGKAMNKDKPAGNNGEKKAEISKIGEDVEIFEGLTASNWHKKNAWEKALAQFNKAAKGKKGDAIDNAYDSLYQTMRELGSKQMVDYHKNMSPAEKKKQIRVLKALITKALDRSQAASMVKEYVDLSDSTVKLLDMIESAAKAQKSNATEPEGIMDKESPKSKQFAKDHEKSDKKIEDNYEDGVKKTTEAGKATKAKSGKRSQDNAAGDTNVVKSTEAPAKGQMEAYVNAIRKDNERLGK
jgi:hypothetical protein